MVASQRPVREWLIVVSSVVGSGASRGFVERRLEEVGGVRRCRWDSRGRWLCVEDRQLSKEMI